MPRKRFNELYAKRLHIVDVVKRAQAASTTDGTSSRAEKANYSAIFPDNEGDVMLAKLTMRLGFGKIFSNKRKEREPVLSSNDAPSSVDISGVVSALRLEKESIECRIKIIPLAFAADEQKRTAQYKECYEKLQHVEGELEELANEEDQNGDE